MINLKQQGFEFAFTGMIAALSLGPLSAQTLQEARSLQGSKLQPSSSRGDQSGNGRSTYKVNSYQGRTAPSPPRVSAKTHEERLYMEAFKEYPDLRQIGSPIRREFVIVHRELCANDPNFFLQEDWTLAIARKASKNLSSRAVQWSAPAPPTVGQRPDLVLVNPVASSPVKLAEETQLIIGNNLLTVNPGNPEDGDMPKAESKPATKGSGSVSHQVLEQMPSESLGSEINEADPVSPPSTTSTTESTDTLRGPEKTVGNSSAELPFTEAHGADIAEFVGDVARSSQMVHVDPYQRGNSCVDGYTRQPSGGRTLDDDMKVAGLQFAVYVTIASVEAGEQWYSENKGEVGKKVENIKRDFIGSYEHCKKQVNGWFK